MVFGKNKGHKYEEMIGIKLLKHGVVIKQMCEDCHNFEKYSSKQESCTNCNVPLKLTAGSGVQEDLIFQHNGKNFSLEIKNNPSDPDWGQCELLHLGNGKWDYSQTAKTKKKKLIEYYDQFNFHDGSIGALEYLKNKKLIPNKTRIPDEEMTFPLRKQDQKSFEDTTHRISAMAFAKFHEKKSDYVQIGGGYGFFHINEDSANLGTAQFDAVFTLRFRAKTTQRHFPLCPNCNKQCTPGDKPKCTRCRIMIPKNNTIGHRCPTCMRYEKKQKDKNKIVPYKNFIHRDDKIEFVITMQNPKISNISNFNLEQNGNQIFPPI
jgi:hypothetical protein